jgi:hypothetical protein
MRGTVISCELEQRFLLTFPEKKSAGQIICLWAVPVSFAANWAPIAFCEAEQRFLLLFLEKEEYLRQKIVACCCT